MNKYKKIITGLVIGLMATFTSFAAMADWSESDYWSGGYGWHHHSYYHHYHHDHGNDLAAGLVVGGLVGIMAGSAMANSQPRYYSAPEQTCYQTKRPVWRHRFCDDDGCYMKTKWAWRTVCN